MKLRSLKIQNFRAISYLELQEIGDTVVIAGANGCGKTQIYHAVRLIKSTYGGYQENEFEQWWGEFNIKLHGPSREIFRVFRNPQKPILLSAKFEIEESEKDFLVCNSENLIERKLWREVDPNIGSGAGRGGLPVAHIQRQHGERIASQVADEAGIVRESLSGNILSARIVVKPDLNIEIEKNPALELLFSTYDPRNVGIIDYHSAQRTYNRQSLGGINLNIRESQDKFKQHTLYNWQNKYSNIKSELAESYVRQLISQQAEEGINKNPNLTETLQELFSTFFPGKHFPGGVPGADGTLDFPVKLESGGEHDIDDLSSGEKEVLFGYLRLRNNAPRNSIILIDEPELHLNPALLRGFPDFYHRHIGRELGNQLWLITHSDALLREAVATPGILVYHMHPAGNLDEGENQVRLVDAAEPLDRALIDLVGDLATYRPGAKVVLFEGGGGDDFDVRMATTLFPKFATSVNAISVGSRSQVDRLHALLKKAAISGATATKFYSIVDKDSGHYNEEVSSFHWDRYHIENYLLEPKYILKAWQELKGKSLVPADDEIEALLKECARDTLGKLISHDLQNFANQCMVSAIRTNFPWDAQSICSALRAAIDDSENRITLISKNELSMGNIEIREREVRSRLENTLLDGSWRESFRGRDVLRQFVGAHVKDVKYEIFRNLVLHRMRDDGFQPPGMRIIIENILAD